jgi:O-antigen ligase
VTAVEGGTNRASRLIGWPLTIAGLTYLVIVGGGFVGVFAPTFRIVDIGIAALALGLWLVVAVGNHRWRPATVLWPAFGSIVGVFALSTVTSVLPRFSLEYVAYAIVVIALYLLLVRLQAHSFIGPRLGSIAVILLGAIAIYYLYVSVTLWQAWWAIVGRVTVPPLRPGFESLAFGNPSALGATCVLLYVAGVAQLGLATPGRRVVAIALGILTLAVCLITGARSVWLGAVVMVGVVAVLWIGSRSRRAALVAILRTGRGRAGLIAVLAAGGVAAVVAGPGILVRMGFGDPYRPGYWLASLRMFGDKPLLGEGPGTWAAERAPHTTISDLDFYIPHGHNVFLQTMGELGIVGVAAGVVVIVVVVRLIIRSLSGSDEQRRYGWAAIAAIAYLAGHQLVDVVTNLPVVLFALALPISRLDALALRARGPEPASAETSAARHLDSSTTALVAGVVVVAIAVAGLAWSTRIAVQHQDAVDAANDGNWARALALAGDVVAADPDIPAYRVTLGLALARAGQADAAAAELRRAATIDEFPQAWLDVAALDQADGDVDGAREALGRALRLGRQQAAIALPAAVIAIRLGDRDLAIDAARSALVVAPSIVADEWWTTEPALADVRAAVVDQLTSAGSGTVFEIALRTGQVDEAATALGEMSGDTTIQRLGLAAWQGDTVARRQLEDRAAAQPLDLGVLGWNIVVADHLEDLAARNRYRAWADLINGGAGTEAAGYRIVADLGEEHPVGTFGLSYGQYLYLRPIPRDELVPGLPQLVYR